MSFILLKALEKCID